LSSPQARRKRIGLGIAIAATALIVCIILMSGREPLSSGPPKVADAEEVRRGEYLARIGNCISCHTRRGGASFAGGVAFTAPDSSLGVLYSSNITPDVATGIGRWSEAQFLRAMHQGKSPKRGWLFPAFPYNSFTRVTHDDAKAIFAYLGTVEPARYTPPSNTSFFRLRWGMALWNLFFFEAKRFVPDPVQSPEWNRGAYLVNGLGHCGACHTPRNAFLAEKDSAALSGATYPDFVAPGQRRAWSAVNLTAAASGLGAWSMEDLKKYLRTGHSRRAGIFGPMNEVVINGLQYLTDADARAMAVYLKSLPAVNESPQQAGEAAQLQSGALIYEQHCEECHLASGRGAFLKAPPVAGSAVAQAQDPSSLINVILYGAKVGEGSPTPFGAWENMKSFGSQLSNEQVAAVSNYVRASWGNRGSVVTAADVARQR
jgi:mono/diheme cytochrome c family protein